MTPSTTLIVALDAAYEAFASYPRPQRMEASSTREPAKIVATLSSAPLRQLTGEQIGPYAGWALTTVGSVEDYKHFLPRILEQAIRGPDWMGTEPPAIASRLKMAEWRTWPKPEGAAVLEVFLAALRDSIHQHPDDGDASEWLCALSALGEDIQPLLQEWAEKACGNALLQVANLATELPALVSLDPGEQVFWVDVPLGVRAEIVSWISGPQIAGALAGAKGVAENDIWRINRGVIALTDYALSTRH